MNLLRLTDSHLLLDGFEEFLKTWVDDRLPQRVPSPSPEQETWLAAFPPEMRQYWALTYRWPTAGLDGAIDQFMGRSTLLNLGDNNDDEFEIINPRHGEKLPKILWNSEKKELWGYVRETPGPKKFTCTLAQLLVTFGLHSITVGNWVRMGFEPLPDEITKPAELIWRGSYYEPTNEINWWYLHSPQLIWFTFGRMAMFGARDMEGRNWLLKKLEPIL